MTVSIRAAVLLLLSLAGMTSCGMQGDLYLPEDKAEAENK